MNLRLVLLALCQGLFLTNNVAFVAINGLVGLRLAPSPLMATFPVMGYVVGGALFTALVARHQRAWGRQRAFQLGLITAVASTALCSYATARGDFWLLVGGTLLAGYYNANAGLYRFAATELVTPEFKERAISWVLAGGVLGAVAGPNLASCTKNLLPAATFAGSYLALSAVALLALLIISCITFPPLPLPTAAHPGRRLGELIRQPVFAATVALAALTNGVMTLLMASTPIAMQQCAHEFSSTALVLECHVLGMFVPSFVTGSLIKRFGALPIMAIGLLLFAVCIAAALSGVSLMQFLLALLALGVGWNFLYIGSTTLFTATYRPEEKTTAQGAMDFCIYSTMALASLASGALVTAHGWTWLNLGSIAPVVVLGVVLAWLGWRRAMEA